MNVTSYTLQGYPIHFVLTCCIHYAKKSLELNLKTFLKPSDVKTCLEKALESFQQVYLNFI